MPMKLLSDEQWKDAIRYFNKQKTHDDFPIFRISVMSFVFLYYRIYSVSALDERVEVFVKYIHKSRSRFL